MHPIQRTTGGVAGLALAALIVSGSGTGVPATVGDAQPVSITSVLAGHPRAPEAGSPAACHDTGALVLLHGRIRHVGLVRGLRIYQHEAPGMFLRLCDATPQRP